MKNQGNKGERVWQELLNPLSKDIAASEWLLLYTVFENKGICTKNIRERMGTVWKEVNKTNPKFFIIWSKGYDVEKELIRFEDIGILEVEKWEDEEPCWILTEKGINILRSWKDHVKGILGPLSEKLND